MHWILAITNSCNGLRYVTRFSCDIFGFYVAFIYLQKGIQVLTRQGSGEPFYLSIVIALLVTIVAFLCGVVGDSPLFQHYVRVFIKDYGTPLTIIFFTGFVHIGKMGDVDLSTLPTSRAFYPTTDRGWFVHFWDVRVSDVFIAIPFAILLTILFYFDHNGKLWILHSYTNPTLLTWHSILSDSPRNRISPPKACWFPLGYFSPWPNNWYSRSVRNSISERSYSTSSIPH